MSKDKDNAISANVEQARAPKDNIPALLDPTIVLHQYGKANKRLFLLDYDGTLTPIVKDPPKAVPSQHLLQDLLTLTSDPKNQIWIISGRDQAFLEQWLGAIKGLGFSAEHGCFMRGPHALEWENLAAALDMGWQEPAEAIFKDFVEQTPGSWTEMKKVAITWHYRNAGFELAAVQAEACMEKVRKELIDKWEVDVTAGKKNIEVRPRFVNKGYMVNKLISAYGEIAPDFVLCMGDDQTDEDMFRAVLASRVNQEKSFNCSVGSSEKTTVAKYHLAAPADVEVLLEHLANFKNDT